MTVNPGDGLRRPMLAALVLCLLGIGVSVQLTRIHVFVHTDPDYHSVCAVSEGVNCETVAASAYSVFLGLPVSVWGFVGYTIMSVIALWGMSRRVGLGGARSWRMPRPS